LYTCKTQATSAAIAAGIPTPRPTLRAILSDPLKPDLPVGLDCEDSDVLLVLGVLEVRVAKALKIAEDWIGVNARQEIHVRT
jgi:hypothetical protein